MNRSLLSICVASASKLGARRTQNGDEWLCVDLDESADYGSPHSLGSRGVLVAVADGASGRGHQKIGSAFALHILEERLKTMRGVSVEERTVRLHDAILDADRALRDLRKQYQCDTLAAITAVIISGEEIVLGHVGSTAGFLFREGALSELTTQSVIAPPRDESFGGHCLFPQLGNLQSFDPVITRLPVSPDDLILLCTDGVTDERGAAPAIEAILGRASSEAEMAHALIDVGATDDATAVVLRIGSAIYQG